MSSVPHKEDTRPITERPSCFTVNIDVATPAEMLECFRKCDEQLFAGYEGFEGLYSDRIVQQIKAVAETMHKRYLSSSSSTAIIFSGCGTSGRIAYLCCKGLNRVLKRHCTGQDGQDARANDSFFYLIAGGSRSLVESQELPEDSPAAGVRDLQRLERALSRLRAQNDLQRVMVVGVTCGISAPYVMGQLQYAMKHSERYDAVLVGFNPLHLARNTQVGGWSVTCRQVAMELQSAHNGFIVNPVIGPESVTASSRMKGGTAAKVILDCMGLTAISALPPSPSSSSTLHTPGISEDQGKCISIKLVKHLLMAYQRASEAVYAHQDALDALSRMIDAAGRSLRHHRHLYYVGDHVLGCIGFIDASEMYDTYGEDPFVVRGWMEGGWEAERTAVCMEEDSGEDDETTYKNDEWEREKNPKKQHAEPRTSEATAMYALGELFRLSAADFEARIGSLTDDDTVIFLHSSLNGDNATLNRLFHQVSCRTSYVFRIRIDQSTDTQRGVNDEKEKKQTDENEEGTRRGIDRDEHTAVLYAPSLSTLSLDSPSSQMDVLKRGVEEALQELMAKISLNCVSTGACIEKGHVYQNRMINMGVSNDKLFHRSIDIITAITGCCQVIARLSLLRAIYDSDAVEEDSMLISTDKDQRDKQEGANARDVISVANLPTSAHIIKATPMKNIIPCALLLAFHHHRQQGGSSRDYGTSRTCMGVAQAKAMLEEEPVLRSALMKLK